MDIATLKEIGLRLRVSRERANLSAKDVAKIIDVKHSTIHRWENGDREGGCRQVSLVAASLGLEPNDLLRAGQSATESQLSEKGVKYLSRLFLELVALAQNAGEESLLELGDFLHGLNKKWEGQGETIPPGTVTAIPEPGVKTYDAPPLRGTAKMRKDLFGTAGEASAQYGDKKKRRRRRKK